MSYILRQNSGVNDTQERKLISLRNLTISDFSVSKIRYDQSCLSIYNKQHSSNTETYNASPLVESATALLSETYSNSLRN